MLGFCQLWPDEERRKRLHLASCQAARAKINAELMVRKNVAWSLESLMLQEIMAIFARVVMQDSPPFMSGEPNLSPEE